MNARVQNIVIFQLVVETPVRHTLCLDGDKLFRLDISVSLASMAFDCWLNVEHFKCLLSFFNLTIVLLHVNI